MSDEKKDLTSLVELSAGEGAPLQIEGIPALGDVPEAPQAMESEFESLEELSRKVSPEEAPGVEPVPALDLAPLEGPAATVTDADFAPIGEPAQADAPFEAPPVNAHRAPPRQDAPAGPQDLAGVKQFGEKLAIGQPLLDANPPFSLLISAGGRKFDPRAIEAIEDALENENFGLRVEDISVQLSQGKLLIPRVSEYAAVFLAQKLRDLVDNIELGPAGEIFKSSEAAADEKADSTESFLIDAAHYDQHREEIRDLGEEPATEKDVFTSNLGEIPDHQITRVLSAVTASQILEASLAENPDRREFESITESLTRELTGRAFALRANGVIGLNFSLRPIEAYRNPTTGKVERAYRLLATGTAVRAKRRN